MKVIIKLFAVVLLAGLINSVVIAPAICFSHDDAVSQQQENGDCCIVCHPMHHQAIIHSVSATDFGASVSTHLVQSPIFNLIESPTSTIFRPPLVA